MAATRSLLLAVALAAVAAAPPRAAEFRLTSEEFVKEFQAALSKTLAKYGNKVVELTGQVKAVGYDEKGRPLMYLEGTGGLWAGCYFAGGLPWAKAQPGQTATIKGTAHRSFANRIYGCEVVAAKGDAAPRLSADEFAKRTLDPAAKRPRPTYLVVSGEVARLDGANGVVLKSGVKGVEVLLRFKDEAAKPLGIAGWKAGAKVEALGVDAANPAIGRASLAECVPMAEVK